MHWHGPFWWILPLFFVGMMFLCYLAFARRGWRGWCGRSWRRSGDAERIEQLETEVRELEDRLGEQPLTGSADVGL